MLDNQVDTDDIEYFKEGVVLASQRSSSGSSKILTACLFDKVFKICHNEDVKTFESLSEAIKKYNSIQ